jgi:hypothetical protein
VASQLDSIVGRIHEEIDRVAAGEPAIEVMIGGKRRTDLSIPGTPPATSAAA